MRERQALIFGVNGSLGRALADILANDYAVTGVVRDALTFEHGTVQTVIESDYSENSLALISNTLKTQAHSFDLLINATGILHDDNLKPEKRLQDISADSLTRYFAINAVIPGLLLKYFSGLMPKSSPAVFASLSAKVGSISDNRLGGWYGYRASKAALNMLVKTAAIEMHRTHKQAAVVAIHPGTTVSNLSRPFTTNTPADKLYAPEMSAQRIVSVLTGLTADDTGQFFDWSGDVLPW
ncbi:SDR family NAD(P)-dependent oxidoreductase [Kistimonas asteriae]|uniref:SDR family NAD(P)-dependent oxidoreductase n=1 Tax=Kistimonas asteriae TaxID=517724 RepID=UPI001BA4991E